MISISSGATARRVKALVLITILGLIWGLHFSIVKIAGSSGMQLGGTVAATSLGSMLVFVVICRLRRKMPVMRRQAVFYYLACALVGYTVPFFLELYSAPRIGAGILTIVVCLTPLSTVILAVLLKSDTVNKLKLVAIMLGLISVAPLVLSNAASPAYGWGLLAAFGVPVAYAAYHNIVAKYWPFEQDSWQVAAGEALALCVVVVPIYVAVDGFRLPASNWTGAEWTILLMVAFSTLEIYLYFEIVRVSGAIFVSQANFVTVPTGVVWGMVLFGEQHSSWIYFSVVILAISLILAARATNAAEEDSSGRPAARPSGDQVGSNQSVI
ncbi:MAG: DMT family transporter [Rhodospirillales bacterium]|nr:DMT family transporter [Rhodospirillales bacterium]